MGRETALIDATLRLLRLHGIFCWRNNSGATRYGRPGERQRFVRYGLVGSSDILGIVPHAGGKLIAIECKTGTLRLTDYQTRFLEEVRAHGGLAAVIRSADEVLAWLATIPTVAP